VHEVATKAVADDEHMGEVSGSAEASHRCGVVGGLACTRPGRREPDCHHASRTVSFCFSFIFVSFGESCLPIENHVRSGRPLQRNEKSSDLFLGLIMMSHDLTRFDFEFGADLFYFSFIFVLCGESCLLVSWCAGGKCGMTCSDDDRGRSRRPGAEDQR
jgi:hypothetical protein